MIFLFFCFLLYFALHPPLGLKPNSLCISFFSGCSCLYVWLAGWECESLCTTFSVASTNLTLYQFFTILILKEKLLSYPFCLILLGSNTLIVVVADVTRRFDVSFLFPEWSSWRMGLLWMREVETGRGLSHLGITNWRKIVTA